MECLGSASLFPRGFCMGQNRLRLGKGCSGPGPLPEEDLAIIVSLAFGVWPERECWNICRGFSTFCYETLGFSMPQLWEHIP